MHPKGIECQVGDQVSVKDLPMDNKVFANRLQKEFKDLLAFHEHAQVDDHHQGDGNGEGHIRSGRAEQLVQFYVDQVSQSIESNQAVISKYLDSSRF